MSSRWKVEVGDCIEKMQSWQLDREFGEPKLIVADPPFNIGRDYDICQDDRPVAEYLAWTEKWGRAAYDLIHPHGSMWVAIYPNMVSEVDCTMKRIGWHKRGQIIWAFTFGVNNPKNFTQAYTCWLYYSRAKTRYTFNADDPALRQPSARQLLYKDKRANPKGRLPDNVWVLNLNEIKGEIAEDMNLWVESRVCGTFKERVKGSDNQMPLAVISRIVRACSNPGELVVDCFGGTFTTGEVCVRLDRDFVGCDLSAAYCERGRARLSGVAVC